MSVIVPHHGDPTPTKACVELLRCQDYAGTLQIIVVDDASPNPFPPVPGTVLVRQSVNGGFGRAVNAGAAVSQGDLILILNSDTKPTLSFVREFVESAGPYLPAVCGVQQTTDGRPAPSSFLWPRVRDLPFSHLAAVQPLLRRWPWLAEHALPRPPRSRQQPYVDWVSGAALLIPRGSFDSVGGFDEDFHMYWEDVDLQSRLAETGVPAVSLPDVSIEHRVGGSSDEDRQRLWEAQGQQLYFSKRGRGAELTAVWTFIVAANAAYDLVRRMAGRRVTPLSTARKRWATLRAARLFASRARARGGGSDTVH